MNRERRKARPALLWGGSGNWSKADVGVSPSDTTHLYAEPKIRPAEHGGSGKEDPARAEHFTSGLLI
jgi:hypothetical protein